MKKARGTLSLLEWKMLRWLASGGGHARSFIVREDGDAFISGRTDEFRKEARKAAVAISKRGWTYSDSYGNHRLNEAGRAAAESLPEPAWQPPPRPPLHDRDFEVLNELKGSCDSRYDNGTRFYSPYECGGTNGSHHSASLAKLCRHELVERSAGFATESVTGDASVPRPTLFRRAKGSKHYRITALGRDRLAEWQETQHRGRG